MTILLALILAQDYRGYTIMEGGLGREPKGPDEMWPNTAANHLKFVKEAAINLVVVEVPYGVGKDHPKSDEAAALIQSLKKAGVEVWIVYPHVLAQTFDLPRQVDDTGKKVDWNCCFNSPEVHAWMIENGKSILKAYAPDGLILFGTFHVGNTCDCGPCKKRKPSKVQEDFFAAWRKEMRAVAPKVKLGTTDFWAPETPATLAALDVVCPVVAVFNPGYAGKGKMKEALDKDKSRFRGKAVVPYVKLFLADQTDSSTDDVLAAAREAVDGADGFFFWGYNPGHSYKKQDYDHPAIVKALAAMGGKKKKTP